ncbi:MAG: DUF4132 domain-containing protein [Myxococcota bacterium]
MLDDQIRRWVRGSLRPDWLTRHLPARCPPWLQTNPPRLGFPEGSLSWRHAVVLLEHCAEGMPMRAPLRSLLGAEAVEAFSLAVLTRWLADPVLDRVSRVAIQNLAPHTTARRILSEVCPKGWRRGSHSAKHFVESVVQLDVPVLWTVLCALALWPRRRGARQAIREALHAHDARPHGAQACWRAVLLSQLREPLDQGFGLAGYTVRVPPQTTAFFRYALFEDAMLAEKTWTPETWEARIAPHLSDTFVHYTVGETVQISHPIHWADARIDAERQAVAAEDEPFTQRHRAVYRLRHDERRSRMVTRFRECSVPGERLAQHLLRRGWGRGEVWDYPRVMDLFHPWPAQDWCATVRFFPGIPAPHPRPSPAAPQTLHGVSFLKGATSRPEYGGDWRGVRWEGNQQVIYGLENPRHGTISDRDPGRFLSVVPPAVFSETLRTIAQLCPPT